MKFLNIRLTTEEFRAVHEVTESRRGEVRTMLR
jgi:hypothetical protein